MFALIDCNNFFASCELVFNPKLEEKPLVILSNNDGCIISRCPKAKKMGIQMGEPAFHYKGRKDINMLSSNFALYSDMSQRVIQTLSSFAPNMEVYSIDESFFQMEKSDSLYDLSLAMRKKVKQWTGIPISIGLASTKTLAKLANRMAKKSESGVYLLPEEKTEELLAVTDLQDIWGIGRRLTEHLHRKGIYNALQLIQTDDIRIQKWLGVTGYRTVLELRGIPCLDLEIPEKRKSIICSRSFGYKVKEIELLHEAIATFAAHAAEKLREQASLASFMSIYLVVGDEYRSCHLNFPHPTSFTPQLISFAKKGVSQLYCEGLEYKKAGVMLGNFCDEEEIQTNFLAPELLDEKKARAMQVLDQVNERFEKTKVRFAAEGIQKTWKSKRDHTTPKFTTSWNELLRVK